MRVKQGVVPPQGTINGRIHTGWHFPAGKDWSDPVITGETHEDLIARVTRYRIDNSLELGSPEEDIAQYICTNWSHYCWPEDSVKRNLPEAKHEPPVKDTLIKRLTIWLANRYSNLGQIELEPDNEAQRRATICINCPANKEWRNNCAPCVDHVERHSVLVRRNREVPQQNYLLGCAVAGHDNAAAVFLPERALRHRKHYKLPEICWMNGLTE